MWFLNSRRLLPYFPHSVILPKIGHLKASASDQKIVGNLFQPIGGLITGNCIHQGFRRKATVDVIGQIGNIQFPRIL